LVGTSSLARSTRAAFMASVTVRSSARSKPFWCVPPCGVATTLQNDWTVVS
jgi:hypothetical protein